MLTRPPSKSNPEASTTPLLVRGRFSGRECLLPVLAVVIVLVLGGGGGGGGEALDWRKESGSAAGPMSSVSRISTR